MPLSVGQIDSILNAEVDHECAGIGEAGVCVRIVSIAELPTRTGRFQIVAFWNNRDAKEHVAILHGDPTGGENLLTRLHSECLTGDAIGSLRCDCRDQLEAALRRIDSEPAGIVLYMRQEGRGIGLLNKLRAYALQDRGLDTVEANEALGFRDDEREYSIAAHMLKSLRVASIRLLTNNPHKVEELTRLGVHVKERVPHVIAPNEFNRFYLETKRDRSGHLFDLEGKPRLADQGEMPEVGDEEYEGEPGAVETGAGVDGPVRLPIEDTLDLHSFRPDEVASVVEEYLREAHAEGFAQVRIIHGRGIGVQREIVRAVLARTLSVISFADAPPGAGEWGATIAHLAVSPSSEG